MQASTHGSAELVECDWVALGAVDEHEHRPRNVNRAVAAQQPQQPQQLSARDAAYAASRVQRGVRGHQIVDEGILRRVGQADVAVCAKQRRGALCHRPKVLGDESNWRGWPVLEQQRDDVLHVRRDPVPVQVLFGVECRRIDRH